METKQAQKTKIKILFSDDDLAERAAYERWVKQSNAAHNYRLAGSLEETRTALREEFFDVVVVDYNLGDGIALDLLKEDVAVPLIVITGRGSEEIAANALHLGVYDYLIKDEQKNYFNILSVSIENAILHFKNEIRLLEMEQKYEELKEEFKQFTYIISHDLNAPLRGIQTIANWIREDYADKLDQDGKDQLHLMTNRVSRMQMLLEGVLKYSRLTRMEEEAMEIDLSQLADETIGGIDKPETVSLQKEGSFVKVKTAPKKLKVCLEQLLKNAVDAVDPKSGRVTLAFHESEQDWQLDVKDNGCGIPEAQLERVFQMFQTLKPRDEVERAGVGLTLVKRAIETMQGTLDVRSNPDEGTIFTIKFNKPQAYSRGVIE